MTLENDFRKELHHFSKKWKNTEGIGERNLLFAPISERQDIPVLDLTKIHKMKIPGRPIVSGPTTENISYLWTTHSIH